MPDNSVNNSIADYIATMSQSTEETLRSIDLTLKAIAKGDGLVISQSSLKDLAEKEKQASQNASKTKSSSRTASPNRNNRYDDDLDWDKQTAKKKFEKFSDQFEKSFTEALFGVEPDFKKVFNNAANQFANSFGVQTKDLGKVLGVRVVETLKSHKVIGPLADRLQKEGNWIKNRTADLANKALNSASTKLGGTGGIDIGKWFEDDRTNEEPNVGDIDKIVNSNIVDLQSSIIDNINDLREQLEAGNEQDEEASNTRNEQILEAISSLRDLLANTPEENANKSISEILQGNANPREAGEGAASALDEVENATNALGGEMGAVKDVVSDVAGEAFPALTTAMAVASVLFAEDIDRVKKSLQSWSKSLHDVMFRSTATNAKFMELQKQRMEEDQKALVNTAYKVITESAEKIEQVWDNVLTTVAQTQGYSKEGVQDLWSNYAARLKSERLSSYISSADIMEKLESVLQSGLSGQVAEEFAYIATKLNAAIPTQDFFQYASTYASIAANAIKNGVSQENAIKIANQELESFASNVLYASREIAGGFTTSLKDASSLFDSATKIAMTSRTGDISNISGVLTSVSAIVGAIAPDVASSLVDSVVKAATGGNSSDITALRSMAGVGASNTAFLQEFAKDPQKIFATLFKNLANLQNMSADNYMEVAEGLSQVFGLSMDAFARVDFGYLADAITSMDLHSDALQANIDNLGEATSSAEQQRMQEINKYMIDEGLAYVLDNEAGRLIQQHMWDEQLAQQITQSLFAVDLKGESLNLLNSILSIISKIKDLVSPSAWAQRINDLTISIAEMNEPNEEVAKSLEKYAVGQGNSEALRHLLTTGEELYLANRAYNAITGVIDIEQMIGDKTYDAMTEAFGTPSSKVSGYKYHMVSKSEYAAASSNSIVANLTNKATSFFENIGSVVSNIFNELKEQSKRQKDEVAKQKEQANDLSKAITESIRKYDVSGDSSLLSAITSTFSLSVDSLIKRDADLLEKGELKHRSFASDAEITASVAKQMASLREGSTIEGTFEHWLEQFQQKSDYSNLKEELKKYGQDISIVEAMFEQQQAINSSAATKARQLHEVQFWEDMQNFATVDFPWYMREWERYYIQHEAYNEATGGVGEGKGAYQAAVELRAQEQGEFGDSVFALAKALTENKNWQEELGDKLKEPAVQTNALLAQILLLVDAIRQQGNESAVVSIPSSLAALGLGVANK